jgi:putative transposase
VAMNEPREVLPEELARRAAAAGSMDALKASGAFDELMAQIDSGRLELDGKDGFIQQLIKASLERGLQAELSGHLGYEKGDPIGRFLPNARNGAYPKTLGTSAGEVDLAVPRDRDGSFTPRLVPKGARRTGGLDDMIISLYAGGMTVRDIAQHLESTLGTELSHETISKITDDVLEEVLEWQKRPLEPLYPILYLDAIIIKVRDGHQVQNRAAHLAVGVDMEGLKHVLGIWVEASEGAKFWAGVCAELANRGVKDVLIVCCDGLTGFPEAVAATWPAATVQTLSVHNSDGGTVPPATCTVAGRTHADTHPSRTPCRPVPPRRRQTVNQPAGAATPGMVIAEIRFWRGTPTQPGEPQVVCP